MENCEEKMDVDIGALRVNIRSNNAVTQHMM